LPKSLATHAKHGTAHATPTFLASNCDKIRSKSAQQSFRRLPYIKDELLNPIAAANTTDTIIDAIFKLENMPKRVPLVRDERLAKMGIRGLIILNYISFFRINENVKSIEIIRVLYSRRDWKVIL